MTTRNIGGRLSSSLAFRMSLVPLTPDLKSLESEHIKVSFLNQSPAVTNGVLVYMFAITVLPYFRMHVPLPQTYNSTPHSLLPHQITI